MREQIPREVYHEGEPGFQWWEKALDLLETGEAVHVEGTATLPRLRKILQACEANARGDGAAAQSWSDLGRATCLVAVMGFQREGDYKSAVQLLQDMKGLFRKWNRRDEPGHAWEEAPHPYGFSPLTGGTPWISEEDYRSALVKFRRLDRAKTLFARYPRFF